MAAHERERQRTGDALGHDEVKGREQRLDALLEAHLAHEADLAGHAPRGSARLVEDALVIARPGDVDARRVYAVGGHDLVHLGVVQGKDRVHAAHGGNDAPPLQAVHGHLPQVRGVADGHDGDPPTRSRTMLASR